MLKRFFSLSLIVGTIFLSSCTIKPEAASVMETSALVHLPNWVLNPQIEGSIAAVGIAPKSKGGLQFQIPKAEADARANIAAQISTEVSRLTKNSLREAQLDEVNDVENVFTQATKNLIKKIPISGSRRINMYVDPNDGSLYVHMSLDSKMIATYFEQNKNYMKTMVENAALSRDRLNQAQAAVDSLYEELNKEIK
jgi:gas vesicle protein